MSQRVTFRPLGSWTRIAEGYLRALDLGVVPPAETTRRMLDLEVTHCAERRSTTVRRPSNATRATTSVRSPRLARETK